MAGAAPSVEPGAGDPLGDWLEAGWARAALDRHVEVEGARIAYRDWGCPDPGSDGLVFVHGFLAHARWWDHIAPRFADRFHVIAPDLSGMGDSDWRQAYDRRQYAREAVAAIRAAGLRQVTIVAHSFGSLSSLYAASLAPELIARVIVLDAHVFRLEAERLPEAVEPEKRYATKDEALSRYRLKPPGQWPIPAIVDYVARHSLREIDGEWGWKFDPRTFLSVNSQDMRNELRGLTTKVDFIRAENSEVIGKAELDAFVRNLPACGDPVTVPLSHHHLMIEQPVALVAALAGLLANRR